MSDHPAEPVYRDALAQAHQELGDVFRDEERWPEAERELKEAAALWGALAREQPEIAEYRSKLADAHGRLGYLYMHQTAHGGSRSGIPPGPGRRGTAGAGEPRGDRLPGFAGDILLGYACCKRIATTGRAAKRHSNGAVAIRENLARDHPEVTKASDGPWQIPLATWGTAFAAERKFPQAEEALKRSIAILEKLAADHPQDIEIAADLAECVPA